MGGISPGKPRRGIRPANGQTPTRAWLDNEATFNLQDACRLFHSALVAGLGGDHDHAIEHNARTVGLTQALLERGLQSKKRERLSATASRRFSR